MTIYDEIIKLRDSTTLSLHRVQNFPKLKPYGSVFTATIVAGGEAFTEVFKFNPASYASEDMDNVLMKLVRKAHEHHAIHLVDGELRTVECIEGVLDYLLQPEYNDEDERESYRRSFPNGVTVSADGRNATIPGTAIRYALKHPTSKRSPMGNDWKRLDDSVLVVINAVAEWKDEAADIANKKLIEEWLVSTAGDVVKAHEYLSSLKKLIELEQRLVLNK